MLHPQAILVVMTLALLAAAPLGVAPDQPFARFAHPTDGDHVQADASVHVTAIAMFADPPADARLQSSEDSGQTWTSLSGAEVHGHGIAGTYEATASQGTIVKFRTVSPTTAWFNTDISVFVD